MQLVEEYQEIVERDAAEISCLWKYVQMFLYFLCIISGCICSILFYAIWEDSFGGDCLLWADFIVMPHLDKSDIDIHEIKTNYNNWWRYVVLDTELIYECTIYLITCFSSCIFGIMWFTFFSICGKGGYDVAINERSWRIVAPAILFNFIFAIISIFANYNFQEGFKEFNTNIHNIFYKVYNSSDASKDVSDCEIIRTYVDIYHFYDYDVCDMLSWQQVISFKCFCFIFTKLILNFIINNFKMFSRIMMWSWIGGLILLLLRIIIVTDFKILKVTIYELPLANILGSTDKNEITNSNTEENKKNV
nr:PREDICTED: uncharacterized protein LOC105662319 isoform X1 [Megachile rotundata]